MDAKAIKLLLSAVDGLCENGRETDPAGIASALGIPLSEGQAAVDYLEAEGLAYVCEYGFSCSVEFSVEGLTEKGKNILRGSVS